MSAAAQEGRAERRWDLALWAVMVCCLVRLWLMPLPSSFWVDEMGTMFVVRHPGDASLQVVPQVPESIYYALARLGSALPGPAEIAYRLPSVLLMALGVWLVARAAARMIAPEAAWFAAFACFSLKGINSAAADARPYAMGMAVAAAAMLALARWFDEGRWRDAAVFAVCGALLWRVHLVFWPFYLVFGFYAGMRLWRRSGKVKWKEAAAVFALMSASLMPVALQALALLRQATAHVVVAAPGMRELIHELKLPLIVVCVAGVWAMARLANTGEAPARPGGEAMAAALAWWLITPLVVFAYSRAAGTSLFVPRYLSLELPGAAVAATALAACLMPRSLWKPAACLLGAGVLLYLGQWRSLWPAHHPSDWRGAVAAMERLSIGPATPVICPSPFVEAQPPVWRPGYPQETFLYCHLLTYPPPGRTVTFPFLPSAEAERYAAALAASTLAPAGRFAIYGGQGGVEFWEKWFARRPELAGWAHGDLRRFGDVRVALFQAPAVEARVAADSSARNTSAIQSASASSR